MPHKIFFGKVHRELEELKGRSISAYEIAKYSGVRYDTVRRSIAGYVAENVIANVFELAAYYGKQLGRHVANWEVERFHDGKDEHDVFFDNHDETTKIRYPD